MKLFLLCKNDNKRKIINKSSPSKEFNTGAAEQRMPKDNLKKVNIEI